MPGFRVIVIGAGPAGLFAAHALTAAGIDFVVLERQPEIVRFRGALLVLFPPLLRLLDQLGLYEAMLQQSTRMTTKTNFTYDGEFLCMAPLFEYIEHEFGYPVHATSRGHLLSVLYDNLPGRETKVRSNAHVVNIETAKDGVRVHLADGSVVDGSMVMAGDGVHSPARGLIQRLGHSSSASVDSKPTSPMVAEYLSIFGSTDSIREDVKLGDFAESHGHGIASQSMRLRDRMYFTILKRLEGPPPERTRFTNEDAEAFAREMSDLTIFPGVKLKEIWPGREQTNTVLLHQENGVAEKWYHGRIVIFGDSAHKMTSIAGQGALAATLSSTSIVNNLRAALQKNPMPSTEDLEACFAKYQASRREVTAGVVQFGSWLSRFITWTGEEDEKLDRESSKGTSLVNEAVQGVLPWFAQAPILDFIPFDGQHGNTPWEMKGKSPIRPRL
ncbi:hypothetical protein NUW58_g7834 [Xylaria curta]|uniref:Uncharacterized protein n=1 Tax=Xylaria curta TaxID=42375 RepID=A0ACC1NG23_9PEZI|nr:hypothetical protein NUW58_g7834 [Xylaria curta]